VLSIAVVVNLGHRGDVRTTAKDTSEIRSKDSPSIESWLRYACLCALRARFLAEKRADAQNNDNHAEQDIEGLSRCHYVWPRTTMVVMTAFLLFQLYQ